MNANEAFELGLIILSAILIASFAAVGALHFSHIASTPQCLSAQCGLSMSLYDSTLVIESQEPAAYKIFVNGTQVWPCPECVERKRLAVPLGWQFAEVEVLCRCGARQSYYVVRLRNGTYAFAWNGQMVKGVCIR